MRSEKILLWGWFGEENIGDDLLLNTFLAKIASNRREFTIPMATKYAFSQRNIHEIQRSYSALFYEAIRCDTLIIGPGGLFPFDDIPKLIAFLNAVCIWKLLNRKVIFFGIGISEKMSRFSTFLWRQIIKKTDLFLTRSPGLLKKIGIQESKTVHTISDTAFASDIKFREMGKSKCALVSVANIYSDKDSSAFHDSVNVWSYIVQRIIAKGYNVDLVAFTKGLDDELIVAIKSNLSSLENHIHIINYTTLLNSLNNWGEYSFSVCMRFHALVLSILADVPPFSLAYGHKTYSLAKLSNLEEYTMIWNCFQKRYYGVNVEFSIDKFNQKFEHFLSNQNNIRTALVQEREKHIESALQSFYKLENSLDE